MSLDRLKSAIVQGVATGLVGSAIKDKQNRNRTKRLQSEKVVESKPRQAKSEYFSIPSLLLADLKNTDSSPELRTQLREAIVDARLFHTDNAKVKGIKLNALRSYANIIDGMPKKGNASKAKAGKLTGKGDYTWRNFGGDALSGAGYAAGGALGALTGNPYAAAIGGSVGGSVGREIGTILGMGDYTVNQNSLAKASYVIPPGMPVPQFGATNTGTRIKHREYAFDLVVPAGPTGFVNTAFTINPGNAQLFPWLSSVALQYQQYEIHGMVVEYRTMSSDITAGGALGTVIIATNYDVLENAYPSKVVMENAQFSVSTKPSCSMIHTIECDPKQRPTKLLYVRSPNSSTTASQDARFMDLGSLEIATTGLPGAVGAVMGEIWISYDVSFYKPEVTSIPFSFELLNGFVGSTSGSPFGTVSTRSGANYTNIPVGQNITYLSPGQYIMEIHAAATVYIGQTLASGPGGSVAVLESVVSAGNIIMMLLVTTSVANTVITYTPSAATFTMDKVRVFRIA